MDFLRKLLRVPMRLVGAIWLLVRLLLRGLLYLVAALVGTVQWRAPAWMRALGRQIARAGAWIRANPRPFAAGALAVVLAVGGGWFGWRWWQSRPKPELPPLVTFEVTAPERTNYEEQPITVHPLKVRFSGSIAPLALAGKDVEQGIRIDPAIEGRWRWEGDKELVFDPKGDWPVGQQYWVAFERAKAFAPQIRIETTSFKFDTAPFSASIDSGEFYQNPQEAAQKKAVFTVSFGHPVDPPEFESRVALELVQANGDRSKPRFVVSYDDKKLHGYVHSEPLGVPASDSKVHFTLAKGVRAARGGPGTSEPSTSEVTVPGRYSLNLGSLEATLAENDRSEPDQVLVMAFSEAVHEREANKAVHAWVLPKFHPNTKEADRIDPYDWTGSESQIGENILKLSKPLPLEALPTEREYVEAHSYKHRAEPGQYLFVKVDKGVGSFGGYVLGSAQSKVLAVPEFPRVLKFMSQGSLLALGGERQVAVAARNVPGMKVEIARVLPEQLQHLVTFNRYGSYAVPDLGSLSPDQITERHEQTATFEDADARTTRYEGVDLGRYLGASDASKHGVFLLKLSMYEPKPEPAAADDEESESEDGDSEGGYEGDYEGGDYEGGYDSSAPPTDNRLVVVTDLGVIVKKALDGSQDVYVASLARGAPVEGATVEVVAKNGVTVLKQVTDAAGRARFPSLKGLEREKEPAMYVVRRGDDLSFLPVSGRDRRLDFSRFDIGGDRNAKDAGKLGAYLFSDRGMYRPGDTFHIGMIVRAADWSRELDGVPLEAEVVDARGMTVDRRKLRLDPAGFLELSYTPSEAAPTGAWNVNLYLVKDGRSDKMIGSTTVQVKEFLPDRMKINARLSRESAEGWVKPDQLAARVALANLFGTPAQDRRVEATLTLTPTVPRFAAYPQHSFTDPLRTKDGYSTELGARQTDGQGEAEFPLGLEKYGAATFQLTVLTRGFEAEGGRSVASAARSLVSSLDALVGVKTDGDLDYIKRDAARKVNLVAIDPAAKRTAQEGLKAVLIEHQYVSVLTQQSSGLYKYESKLRDRVVSESALAIPAAGLDYPLATQDPGSYALVVRGANGLELNRVEYVVSGEANVARSLERNAELQLALSKKDYAPGEEIEIAIRAPYAGSGLITIERDAVVAHAWFKSATTSTIQKIKVPADFEGNGYVNVQYLRDPASDEIYMSPLSYGVAPFSVARDARRNRIGLKVADRLKPGDTLAITLTAPEASRVAVFAIDEGILQVARYKLGDPLDLFFRKKMLEVQTSEILDLVLPEFSRLAGMDRAPGGDEDGLLGRHLNPFKRKRQVPVAYWSGIVDAKQGDTVLSYVVPEEFNGRLRVMAVAVTRAKIGIAETGATVRGDFVLSPNAPTMVAPGDEFEVSVGVANNLENAKPGAMPVSVELVAADGLSVVGEAKQSLSLAAMKEGSARFRLKAGDQLGPAKLRFTTKAEGAGAAIGTEVSVRPAVPYRSEVRVGTLGKGEAEVRPLTPLYDAFARREATAAYTPLVLAQGIGAYLADYPHYCTEQLVSQGMPALVFANHPEFGTVKSGAKPDALFDGVIGSLRARQNGEGGFGYWTSTPVSERFVSAWAMQFLVEARERGRNVPGDLLAQGNAYLNQLAADESDDSLDGLRERAFAAYLLTRQGNVTTNALAAIEKRLGEKHEKTWRDDAVAAYIGAAMKLMQQDKAGATLIERPLKVLQRHADERPYRMNRYYDPLVGDAVTLYLASRHFPDRAKALPAEALSNVVLPLQKGYFNTLSGAMTILALEAYAGSNAPAGVATLTWQEIAKGGAAKAFGSATGLVVRGSFGGGAEALKVGNALASNSWYSVVQAGYPRGLPGTEIKEGFEITRELTDAAGKPVTSVVLGAEVQVRLRLRSTRPQSVSQVALTDLLPGGFEPVQEPGRDANTNAGSRMAWQPEFVDVRDDRVVLYGTIWTDLREYVYRIKATNTGTFQLPPAYGEGMYDRTIEARSLGGTITVERPK